MGKISVSYRITDKGDGTTGAADPYTFDNVADISRFNKKILKATALEVLREEQSQGFDKEPVQIVDNKRGKGLDDVLPFGKIQFISRQDIKDIIQFTFTAIKDRTFRKTGRYLRSNVVTYNGRQVANNEASFNVWLKSVDAFGPNDRIRFVNTAPYARRLERLGITRESRGEDRKKIKWRKADKHEKKKGGTRYMVPNGIYAMAYRAISNKYKANAMIKFDLLPGSEMGITGPNTTYKQGESRGKSYLYPTILIKATPSGLRGLR